MPSLSVKGIEMAIETIGTSDPRDPYMDRASVNVGENGLVEYRASAIGGCLTGLVAGRLGYTETKPPATLQKAYDRGHESERVIKERMLSEGWLIWDDQLRVEVAVTSKIKVTGSIDGKVAQRAEVIKPYLGEMKSQNDEEWERFEQYGWEAGFWPKYKWQTSVYQIATGLPLCVVRMRVGKDGQITDVKVEYRDEPWYSVADIRRKLLTAEMMAAQMTIPSCDKPIFGCPFWYLPEHNDQVDADRVVVDDEDFEKLCVDYEQSRASAKVLTDKVKRLRPVIEQQITETHGEGAQKLTTVNGVKVTRYEQGNPPSLQVNDMVRDGIVGPDVIEEYTRKTTGWRLKVTIPKTKGE